MFSLSRESEQDLAHGILEVVKKYLEAHEKVPQRLTKLIKEELEDKELSGRGRYLKSVDRYKAMLNAFSIAFDSTVKAETRQKAEHDGLKALDRIPDKHYALLYDMMEG